MELVKFSKMSLKKLQTLTFCLQRINKEGPLDFFVCATIVKTHPLLWLYLVNIYLVEHTLVSFVQ